MNNAKETYGYTSNFPTNFRHLMEISKTSQQTIATICDVQRQSVSQWALGNTKPDIVSLNEIAEYFNVSTDYLLGRTAIATSNVDLRSVCEFTGLSEENVQCLHDRNKSLLFSDEITQYFLKHNNSSIDDLPNLSNFLISFANDSEIRRLFLRMLETIGVRSFVSCYNALCSSSDIPKYNGTINEDIVIESLSDYFHISVEEPNPNGSFELSPEEAFEYYCSLISDKLKNLLISTYQKDNQWAKIDDIKDTVYSIIRQKIELSESEGENNGKHQRTQR